LILVDRDEAGLECTREQLERSGVGVKASAFDLGDKAAIERFWAGVARPGPDILINNAGVFPGRAFNRVDQEFYDGVFAVNLDAVFWMCQGLVKQRAGRGGVIVNIGSIEAILPFKDDLAVYSVSKAGVIAL